MKKLGKVVMCVLLAVSIGLSAVCIGLVRKLLADETEPVAVQCNGTAIQWRYTDEDEWRDLVALSALTGAAGQTGAAGRDGQNGANGVDGKTVEIRAADGYIQWRQEGGDWLNLVALAALQGAAGADGKDGPAGAPGTAGSTVEVRKTETAIQWRYEDGDWQELVALADITGPTGQTGMSGKTPEFRTENDTLQWRYAGESVWLNLYDLSRLRGQDGADGRAVEVRKHGAYVQWRYEDGDWQNLVALVDITGPTGQTGMSGKTPEFRTEDNTLQWRYAGESVWLNLYDLSRLRGQDGAAGQNGANGENGKDGKDGDTPFIGDNGNWWIGTTDTGVKAAGQDGAAGNDGAPGKDGSCPGWFFGEGYTQSVFLQNGAVTPKFREKLSSGGLVSCDGENLKLKKGHNYLVSVTGSVYAQTNDKSGNYSVQMTDGQNDALCRETTRIVVEQSASGSTQHAIGFTRVYSAKDELTLKFALEQVDYNTYLRSFRCTITITALD